MILSGKDISAQIISSLQDSKTLVGKVLAVISVGDNKSAMSYLKGIINKAELVNVEVRHINLSSDISTEEYVSEIKKCNQSDASGILLLTPLPDHIDFDFASSFVDSSKDVDCLTKENSGVFYTSSKDVVGPCTAKAVVEVLKANNYDLTSKQVCIVGASNIVGKPVAKLMLDANATVEVCNYYTNDLASHTKKADIVVVAVGVAKLIKKEHLKNDAIVIDVGINFLDGKLCGDVDYDECSEVSSNITPVPGGVGSITSSIIFQNLSLLTNK